jgi:hypothetical protein
VEAIRQGSRSPLRQEVLTRLESVLENYLRAEYAAHRAEVESRRNRENLISDFTRIRKDVAGPIFRALGEHLGSRKVSTNVREWQDSIVANQQPTYLTISFTVEPRMSRGKSELTFSARNGDEAVKATYRYPEGQVTQEVTEHLARDMTPEAVENIVIGFLDNVFNPVFQIPTARPE